MKSYAEYKDIQGIGGSKDATRYAVDLDLIADGNVWMQMIKSRNETSHNYNGDVADDVIENILNLFFPEMVKLDGKFETLSKVTPNSLFNN
jgi:nucleotidyltransferase substrate binding protein (TIGR01987 family)